MEAIMYDHRYNPPPPETWAKILSSQEEADALALRDLKCPICRFRLAGVYGHSGFIQVKCSKCKFEGPLNLAYFHTVRKLYIRWDGTNSLLD